MKINIIIFGASGDITRKKVIPGLYEWYQDIKKDKDTLNVVGYGRTNLDNESFREKIHNNEFLKDKFSLNNDAKDFSKSVGKPKEEEVTGQFSAGTDWSSGWSVRTG